MAGWGATELREEEQRECSLKGPGREFQERIFQADGFRMKAADASSARHHGVFSVTHLRRRQDRLAFNVPHQDSCPQPGANTVRTV